MGEHQDVVRRQRTSITQSSIQSSSIDTTEDMLSMRPMTTRSQSDYEPSSINGAEPSRGRHKMDEEKSRSRKPRWLVNVKEWLIVSEPSAQAMKDQKRTIYKAHGVDPNDPRAAAQAAAKMHVPMGQVPEGAITSTRGPSPEKAYRQRVERAKKMRTSSGGPSQSMSSSSSSVPSLREGNPATPWE